MIRKMKLSDFEGVNKIFREVQELHVKGRPDIFISSDPCPYQRIQK